MRNTFSSCSARVLLFRLGTVSSIAEVRINGKAVDTLWCSPYVVEIGEFVQEGEKGFLIKSKLLTLK